MEKRKLIVISIDSMITEDMEVFKDMPNMGYLLKNSSVIKRNTTTYPSYTHSIHTSIMTGCYPGTHGVIGNEHFDPGNMEPEWFEKYTDVSVPTLLQEARRHGYTTAEVFWPLTLGDNAQWNIHRAGIHVIPDNQQQVIRERSTPGFFDEVYPYIKDTFSLPHNIASDQLCFNTAEYLINAHQPDIMYIHLVVIDHVRHQNGVFSAEIKRSYEFLDKGFGQILDALRKNGLEDQTIINVTSDHGHLDIKKVISVNRLFRDNGLITVDENGRLTDWKAYLHTCSLSGHVYIKDHDPEVTAQVKKLLLNNRDMLELEHLYTREEVMELYHLDGDFTFVMESYGNASYSSNYNVELITPTSGGTYRTSKATHGHAPYKGVQPAFFLRNPFTDKKVILPEGRIVDQAPTLAKLMGFTMTVCDGKPIPELLEE